MVVTFTKLPATHPTNGILNCDGASVLAILALKALSAPHFPGVVAPLGEVDPAVPASTATSVPVGMLLPFLSAIIRFSIVADAVPTMVELPVAKTIVACLRTSAAPQTPSPTQP